MDPAIGPTVTASSVMLAAYGFGYSALKGEIEGGSNAGTADPDTDKRKAQRSKVNGAFLTASAFSVFALIVFAVLLKPAVNEVQDAFRVDFAFSDYSALDVMFVFLTLVWLLIAVGFAVQAGRLVKTRGNYK